VLADTIRARNPLFQMTIRSCARVVGYSLLLALGMVVIAILLYTLFRSLGLPYSMAVIAEVCGALVLSRGLFVAFIAAEESHRGPLRRSWSLSGGPYYQYSLLLAVFYYGAYLVLTKSAALLPQFISQGVHVVASSLTLALFVPWMYRWMQVCESDMVPATSEG
ncbi:MAG: hypothetical protein M3N19_10095, partial [Candidatus Eremiobacteraeota bacterium]|nr:hypothetical protein [Candidatus Eremiobacteraeota bacterium]